MQIKCIMFRTFALLFTSFGEFCKYSAGSVFGHCRLGKLQVLDVTLLFPAYNNIVGAHGVSNVLFLCGCVGPHCVLRALQIWRWAGLWDCSG